jgi:hypothetical protein
MIQGMKMRYAVIGLHQNGRIALVRNALQTWAWIRGVVRGIRGMEGS